MYCQCVQPVSIVSGCNDDAEVRDYTKNWYLARKAYATNLTMTKGIMYAEVYGTPSCKFCKMAVKLLEEVGVDYTYTDVTDLEERANMNLRLSSPARSVPQIFLDGIHLKNGYNQLHFIITNVEV